MHEPYIYEIGVEGILPGNWSVWFEGMELRAEPNGSTTLRGLLVDQAALFSVLARIQALNLELISVLRLR